MKNVYGWFEVGVEPLSPVMQILNFIIGHGIMVVDPSEHSHRNYRLGNYFY